MDFLALMQKFGPLLATLQHRPDDADAGVDPEVIAELEKALGVLEETAARVQAIRDKRVDTSTMSIAEIDRLIQGH